MILKSYPHFQSLQRPHVWTCALLSVESPPAPASGASEPIELRRWETGEIDGFFADSEDEK